MLFENLWKVRALRKLGLKWLLKNEKYRIDGSLILMIKIVFEELQIKVSEKKSLKNKAKWWNKDI